MSFSICVQFQMGDWGPACGNQTGKEQGLCGAGKIISVDWILIIVLL